MDVSQGIAVAETIVLTMLISWVRFPKNIRIKASANCININVILNNF